MSPELMIALGNMLFTVANVIIFHKIKHRWDTLKKIIDESDPNTVNIDKLEPGEEVHIAIIDGKPQVVNHVNKKDLEVK